MPDWLSQQQMVRLPGLPSIILQYLQTKPELVWLLLKISFLNNIFDLQQKEIIGKPNTAGLSFSWQG